MCNVKLFIVYDCSYYPFIGQSGHSTTTTTAPATGHVTTTPVTTTPGHVTTTPGHATTSPGHVTTTPSHVTTTPGHATTTPGHATTTTPTRSPGIVIIGGDECLVKGRGMLYYIIFLYCLPCVYYRLQEMYEVNAEIHHS